MKDPNFAAETVWTGDCLDVMRGMNDACVDLIYLDPPFNSNRNYEAPIGSQAAGASFKDMWTLSDVNVYEHGELAERNPAAHSIIDAAKLAHGKSMQSYLIFMGIRLEEMRRVLKPEGSIYLHCDDAAGHWLRAIMDAIFGKACLQAQITWKRTHAHNDRMFSSMSDYLLFYSKGETPKRNIHSVMIPFDPTQIAKKYPKRDGRGQYVHDNLMGPGTSDGESGAEWKGCDPTDYGRCWSAPKTGKYAKHLDDVLLPGYLKAKGVHDRLDLLDSAGFIHWTKTGNPLLKRYHIPGTGSVPGNIWTDIPPLARKARERTGYPTQKPLALLERIIKASSDKDDLVFDPFCGCATALVAADRLGRRWAGVDLSPLAVKLVNERIQETRGKLPWGGANALVEPPRRTDTKHLPNYRTHAHRLYGEQEGVCAGCDTHFPFRIMEVDHKLPKARGGNDDPDNLHLLCSGCNRSKGTKTMAEWRAFQKENR